MNLSKEPVVTTKQKINQRLNELGSTAKKSLGQNFLINDRVIDSILGRTKEKIELYPNGQIVEVGPGLGSLTEHLIQIGRDSKKKITLVELDKTFADHWRGQHCDVVEGDALRLDWANVIPGRGHTLVSNLPYQISSSLVIDQSIEFEVFASMVLMFQKEVAQRITAKPKTSEYGILSVIAQSFWDIAKVTDASQNDFWPAPKVSSRVLCFQRKLELSIGKSIDGQVVNQQTSGKQKKDFLSFVKRAFSQRRKLLKKNLGSLFNEKIFVDLNIPPMARAEELSVQDFHRLFDACQR